MDNLCHTLAGLAIGEAGRRRVTALASATLLIGANLPDVDALAYRWGPVTALGFRRGWTHGILAMVVLPPLLAGLMLGLHALWRRWRTTHPPPAEPRVILTYAALAIWSHPLLDLMNSYGVRLLMPFSGRWYYGDALFTGIAMSRHARRRERPAPWRPARLTLSAVAVYALAMFASGRMVRRELLAQMQAHRPAPVRAMVAPAPLNPFRREVVLDLGDAYARGTVSLMGRAGLASGWETIAKHDSLPAARDAARTPAGRTYLRWSRFPFFAFDGDCPAGSVCIRDARYAPQGWAEVAVPVGGTLSLLLPSRVRETP